MKIFLSFILSIILFVCLYYGYETPNTIEYHEGFAVEESGKFYYLPGDIYDRMPHDPLPCSQEIIGTGSWFTDWNPWEYQDSFCS